MQQTTRRLVALLGIGTVLVCALLFVVYHFVIGPQGLTTSLPTLSAVTTGENKACVECHQKENPGIIQQYHDSKHSGRGVQCLDCHKAVKGQENLTEDHHNVALIAKPTPNNCAQCHATEVQQFENSNHSARSWYVVQGAKNFTPAELAKYHLLDANGNPLNSGNANPVYNLIGQDASAQSCEVCHAIGQKNSDGSFGDCTKCHLRHTFDVAQARKPETCAQCHLGPDHPQAEIYNESAHGTYYQANQSKYNMDAPPGTLTVKDFPAPTCATCHMSAFGSVTGTHDVGQRLKWALSPEVASVRPDGAAHQQTMNTVCLNCHVQPFIDDVTSKAEKNIALTNQNIAKGKSIVQDLRNAGLLGTKPFGTPIDFLYFELWHHEGRRARFGAVMGGADYVNWNGIYEQEKALVEMQSEADALAKAKH
ncbi:multiheme c-type cytochrome [Desulfosporosinus sp. PR]|uniref:multiheme c-type cytochrome n=1 Tax=Candidatus Desulfosporosinus nitrosoreducens TaxID=3401928 RepID=UPI0027E9003F|nr:multiheme c-type cytochrome [Desulfosporosinus sp. PR]MDQ7093332.1 multiheme c-type cytochrome [Desulfosporosinus sp. PR]